MKTVDQIKESRFSSSIRTDDCSDFPLLYFKIHIVDSSQATEFLGDSFHFNKCHIDTPIYFFVDFTGTGLKYLLSFGTFFCWSLALIR